MKRRVLLLCTGNSCRSQMAEAILRKLGGDDYEVHSAGTRPAGGLRLYDNRWACNARWRSSPLALDRQSAYALWHRRARTILAGRRGLSARRVFAACTPPGGRRLYSTPPLCRNTSPNAIEQPRCMRT